MGCANSKLDDLPAVALCRERCSFLDEAIHHRYAFAEAHIAYLHSLKAVGGTLHRFFDGDLDSSVAGPTSPVLNLPAQRKVIDKPDGSPPRKPVIRHSRSPSGSHLHFLSDSGSDDEDSDLDSPLHHHSHHGNSSPLHTYGQFSYTDDTLSSYPVGGYQNMNMNTSINYMKNEVTPSVSYEQRPLSAETVRMDMGESTYYPYPSYPPYVNENHSQYSYYGGGRNNDGFFGSGPSYAPSSYYPPSVAPVGGGSMEASSSKLPPPPPPAPEGSAWDFLYPFENFGHYYPPHTPSSQDSMEVREKEGIPDLEDEQEVVKEVYGDQKISQGLHRKNYSKDFVDNHEGSKATDSEPLYDNKPSVVEVDNEPEEYEVQVVDKKVPGSGERSGDGGNNLPSFKASADSDVVREIKIQFDRASESGGELSKILEVGKLHYKKSAAYQVSSKVLQVITPSLPRLANAEPFAIDKSDSSYLDTDRDAGTKSGNLSWILHRLYLWEKKLYEEVKVEEKMRVLHERNCHKLKRLDERGAEAQKIDATRILLRSFSTKIRMAIQAVDKISVTVNKLRDDELWPRLNEVIQGLTRMWKAMLDCHHIQCQAITQAKRLDAAAMHEHISDAQLEATMQLEHELLCWTLTFSCWISEQKGFIRALNNWLMKCLLYVPEETPDGVIPFSPGRIGAPPIFVICNQWAQAMERISEKEVVDSMRDFATSVLHLWDRDRMEMRQRMMANKDTERKVKSLEREDQKIQKEIQALDKKLVLVSGADSGLSVAGQVVYQSETSKNGSLQLRLQQIFEALERFVSNLVKAHEELLQRIEEDRQDRLSGENQRES